jgi:hypothetical protein
MWLFPGFYLLTLDEALECVKLRTSWRKGDWPILGDGAGDYYSLALTSSAPCPIVLRESDEADSDAIAYDSFAAMLETLICSFREGVFFLDDGGYMDMDDASHAELVRKMNSLVEK